MRLERSDLELEVLVNRIARKEIDLQPDYQRGEVWDRSRQQRLIDTILRGWYIPAIHIVEDEELGREFVLDGQQRLQTIVSFFEGGLRVSGQIEPLRDDLAELNNKKFDQLPANVQMRVRRFSISVITLTDYRPEEPSELFFRLNQQFTLTPPEKRNALFGKARDAVKELVRELSASGALRKETVGFSNGRLAYDDVLSRFCVALSNGNLGQQIKNSDVEHFYRREVFSHEVIDRARAAGSQLGEALSVIGGARLNKATLFTWLVVSDYFARTAGAMVEPWFIGEFEALRGQLGKPGPRERPAPAIERMLEIYTNRASYRVLDVASVMLRDLTVHALHALLAEPAGKEEDLIRFFPLGLEHVSEDELLGFATASEWGDLRW